MAANLDVQKQESTQSNSTPFDNERNIKLASLLENIGCGDFENLTVVMDAEKIVQVGDKKYKSLESLIQKLSTNFPTFVDGVRQYIICSYKKHWSAIDIQFKKNEISCIVYDAANNIQVVFALVILLKKYFVKAQVHYVSGNIQNDHENCLFFAIDGLRVMSSIKDLHDLVKESKSMSPDDYENYVDFLLKYTPPVSNYINAFGREIFSETFEQEPLKLIFALIKQSELRGFYLKNLPPMLIGPIVRNMQSYQWFDNLPTKIRDFKLDDGTLVSEIAKKNKNAHGRNIGIVKYAGELASKFEKCQTEMTTEEIDARLKKASDRTAWLDINYKLKIYAFRGESEKISEILDSARSGNGNQTFDINAQSQSINPATGRPYSGKTALHHAIYEKHTDAILILLRHGANSDIEDDNGNTARNMLQKDFPELYKELSEKEVLKPKAEDQSLAVSSFTP